MFVHLRPCAKYAKMSTFIQYHKYIISVLCKVYIQGLVVHSETCSDYLLLFILYYDIKYIIFVIFINLKSILHGLPSAPFTTAQRLTPCSSWCLGR